MIDWARVNELKNDLGAGDFGEIIDLFLEEVEEVIDRLRRFPDPGSLEQELHFLKGSALNLGFDHMGSLCAQGEDQAASGRADTIPIAQIVSVFDVSKSEFLSQVGAR